MHSTLNPFLHNTLYRLLAHTKKDRTQSLEKSCSIFPLYHTCKKQVKYDSAKLRLLLLLPEEEGSHGSRTGVTGNGPADIEDFYPAARLESLPNRFFQALCIL